jgi:hypothetical protein
MENKMEYPKFVAYFIDFLDEKGNLTETHNHERLFHIKETDALAFIKKIMDENEPLS